MTFLRGVPACAGRGSQMGSALFMAAGPIVTAVCGVAPFPAASTS